MLGYKVGGSYRRFSLIRHMQSYAVDEETHPVGSPNDTLRLMRRLDSSGTHDLYRVGRARENDLVLRGLFPITHSRGRPGTVSRFACQLFCERSPPHRVFLVEGGVLKEDVTSSKDILPSHGEQGRRGGRMMRLWQPSTQTWRMISNRSDGQTFCSDGSYDQSSSTGK